MSYYYLSHLTIRSTLSRARRMPIAGFADILAWISLATEFNDLPVRHNEDLINAELAKNLPLDTVGLLDGMPMWDPHVKAFLLLQAHMSRIDLPISDYVGDQTSVLDQTIRITQAGVDLMTEMGRFGAVKQMVYLLQSIKSARWPTDYALSVLPGISEVFDHAKLEGKVPQDLVTTVSLAQHQNSKAILDGLMNNLGIKGRGQFVKAVNNLPDINLTASGNSSSIYITIGRKNALQDRDGRIYAPRFPKPQTEGYFVLVSPTGGSGDEILALKRANWPSSQGAGSRPTLSSTLRMKIEPMEQARKVDVLVMSDAYPGMEWTLKGVEVPAMEREIVQTFQVHVDGGFKDGKAKGNASGSEETRT
jgi:antiviral helicase SLH1